MFQGRFKTVQISNESSVYYVSRYIHLNPVKAGLVKDPVDYEWSSYNGYKHPGINKILNTKPIITHYKTFTAYETFTKAKQNLIGDRNDLDEWSDN